MASSATTALALRALDFLDLTELENGTMIFVVEPVPVNGRNLGRVARNEVLNLIDEVDREVLRTAPATATPAELKYSMGTKKFEVLVKLKEAAEEAEKKIVELEGDCGDDEGKKKEHRAAKKKILECMTEVEKAVKKVGAMVVLRKSERMMAESVGGPDILWREQSEFREMGMDGILAWIDFEVSEMARRLRLQEVMALADSSYFEDADSGSDNELSGAEETTPNGNPQHPQVQHVAPRSQVLAELTEPEPVDDHAPDADDHALNAMRNAQIDESAVFLEQYGVAHTFARAPNSNATSLDGDAVATLLIAQGLMEANIRAHAPASATAADTRMVLNAAAYTMMKGVLDNAKAIKKALPGMQGKVRLAKKAMEEKDPLTWSQHTEETREEWDMLRADLKKKSEVLETEQAALAGAKLSIAGFQFHIKGILGMRTSNHREMQRENSKGRNEGRAMYSLREQMEWREKLVDGNSGWLLLEMEDI
ncbi:hypothetical protein TI39_contig456g00013 [Zymoseptoria brevis]|uniref:Uncharacterized protein n=1 Tax=Zymoseptoria brevis TaxID=1047168 RepID=A0A0F4GKA4_9PEZI|nr:hypothetical protein TI39_contig456g00013 [Zymoseptoria brevis]